MPKAWPPVHRCWIKSWKQKLHTFACQAKGDTAGLCPQQQCVSTLGDLVRTFITMVQGWVLIRIRVCMCVHFFDLASGGSLDELLRFSRLSNVIFSLE